MLKRLAAAALFLPGFSMLWGATYYISPTGSDSNPGTLSQPWAHYPKAASVVTAGDTVLVQPGVYPLASNYNLDTYTCVFTVAGTSNSPITLRALGQVTNQITFEIRSPYYYIDGFTWDGAGGVFAQSRVSGGSFPASGAAHVTMTNCVVQNTLNSPGFGQAPPTMPTDPLETAPGWNTVINCTFNHMTNQPGTVTFHGQNNLVQGCTFENGWSQDCILGWGNNSVMRLNTFTNMAAAPDGSGYGNHPDIFQTFGTQGEGCAAMLFERNYVVNCPIQLQLIEAQETELGGINHSTITNNYLWGVTFQNNVFEDSNMQGSIDIPNVKFYNNTFRRCTNGVPGTPLLDFTWDDPLSPFFRGVPTGGAVINNCFIDCCGPYSSAVANPAPYYGTLTNGAGSVLGRVGIMLDSYAGLYGWGVYSNLLGAITNAAVYWSINNDCYSINASNFTGGVFFFNIPFNTTSCPSDEQWNALGANMMSVRLDTTSSRKEAAAVLSAFTTDVSAVYANSDYNYMGVVGEPNGLWSGDANLVAAGNSSPALAAPLAGSVLLGAGRNLWNLGVTNDFAGNARPQGTGYAIGAFEYSGSPPPPVPPTIALQPQSVTTNAGSSVTFSVGAMGTAPIGYQWLLNGASIPGATGSTLRMGNVQPADAGAYWVVVANSGGSTTSGMASLTVLTSAPVPPSITLQPQSVTTNVGAAVAFSVMASGAAPLSCQWRFNGIEIPGATASVLAKSNTQTNDAGNYSVVVSNSAGTLASAIAVLALTNSVTPATDPSLVLRFDFDEDFSVGRVLDVTGNGHDAIQFDSTNNITQADGVFGTKAGQWTYSFTQSDGSGHTYPGSQYLAVTNVAGIEYLTNATISLWVQFDTNNDNEMKLLGAYYDPIYASGGVAQATNCWFIGRNNYVNTLLTIYSASGQHDIVGWPWDASAETTFHLYSVTVDCPNNIAVAYYDGLPCMTNAIGVPWLRIYGTHDLPWLAIGTASQDGTPQWGDDLYPNSMYFVGKMDDVRLWNRTLSAQDASDLFHGIDLPAVPAGIATQPASLTNGSGDNVSFSVVPYGTMPISYQWSFNTVSVSGATNASYALSGILAPNAGGYQVAVSNAYGMVTSAVASLTVTNPLPTYNSNGLVGWWKFDEGTGTGALDSSYNNGNLTLHGGPTWVAGVSNSALSFSSGTWADSLAMVGQAATNISIAMWVQPNDASDHQELLNYGTDADHSIVIMAGWQSGFYNVFMGNVDGSGGYPNWPPSLFALPMTGLGGPWDHICYASDGSTIWCYLNGTLVHTVSGSMNTIGVPTQVSIGRPIGTASYYFYGALDDVRIYNRAITGPEVLALFYGTNGIPPVIAPAITSQPQSQTNVAGANVTFSVTAQSSAGTPVYQWHFNGALDVSQSSSAYVLNGITTNNAGGYQVVVTNIGGAVTSAVATLTVTNGIGPAITSQPQDWTGITNSTISLTITATGTAPLAYQWKQNGSGLAGASLSGYSKANAVTGDSGTYTVIVTNTYGSTNSGNAIVTVTNGVTPPPVTNGPSSEIIYVGTLVVGGTNAP